jgi:hypothetical protein
MTTTLQREQDWQHTVDRLTRERDEALAQVAALMDLVRETALLLERVSDYDAPRLLLRVNAAVNGDAAAARDAALVARGRREGIEACIAEAAAHDSTDVEGDPIAESNVIGYRTARDQIVASLRALATSPDGESPSVVRLPGEGNPQPGDLWVHHSGRVYRIDRITNTAHPSAKFPPTVVYVNVKNGTEWSRALSDWHRSFKPFQPKHVRQIAYLHEKLGEIGAIVAAAIKKETT